ncbi:MAG: M1 family metallopeptidase [Candidatus Palauibacterales bacterium]|nr:M1 family metallopeptidase [Candidatus Palauibacterales bacterium]
MRKEGPVGAAAALALAALLGGPGAGPAAAPQEATETDVDPSPGFDVLHYDYRVSLAERDPAIEARQRVRFRVDRGGLARVRLHLEGLEVDSALAGGRRVPASRTGGAGGAAVSIPLADSADLRPGDTATVTLFYGGRPEDGLILRENVHGDWTAFADNWPNRARHWFASVDHPADKASVTHRLEVPADWATVANGVKTADRPVGPGRRLHVWRQEAAIPVYTMVIGAGRLAVVDNGRAPDAGRGGHDVPVTRVVFPEDVEVTAGPFRRSVEMIEIFARLVAPFPYRKLAQVQSATRYGGMENAGAIFYSEEALAEGTMSETTVAHEVAHQWFGDAVTEARWTHLWLSEGFATYFGAVFHRVADGEERFRREMREAEEGYLSSDAVGRPVIRPERPAQLTDLLSANNYEKGGWVLHMLRGVVGDSAFFDGLRRYYEAHRDRAALTRDLRAAVEEASGRDLGWFFDQWLRRPGHPRLAATWEWLPDQGVLELDFRQEQEWPPYRLKVPVSVETEPGGTLRRSLWIPAERSATRRVPLPAPPSAVAVDPDNRILGPVTVGRAGG